MESSLGKNLSLKNGLKTKKCIFYLINRVVTRRLVVDRPEKFYEEIENFVERNMGRKYKFSVRNYIANRNSSSEDKKTYFCSSLIAKLYKNLELLDAKKSSTQYLPHSFSEK